MKANSIKIHSSWKEVLSEEFEKPYFTEIRTFLKQEIAAGKILYPPGKLIFNAFDSTPFDQLKVVILGQDPYHNPGEAMGLCFSVPKGKRTPPSLRNIYKEIQRDVMTPIPDHGDLTYWTEQGVFLLNAMLSVEQKRPGSHKKIGWQEFTDAVISKISDLKKGVVFLLWGNFARNKKKLIDTEKHFVLEAAHPSPLAGGAFFGCKHFSKTNHLLKGMGMEPIDWSVR
jgi:uracil-DNA glycosylase